MVTKVADQKSKRALPSTERAAKGLSLNALLKSAVPIVKNNAEECVIKAYNPDLQTKGGMPAVRAKVVNMLKRGHEQHTVTIIGLDKDIPTIAKQKRIQVDCSCEFYLYRSEYALWTWGAAKIKRSNGQPATVTNPGNHPLGGCKHIYAVLKLIKQRGD